MAVTCEPGTATVEAILSGGHGLCSGYVPHTVPGEYVEVWEFEGYVYLVGPERAYPMGVAWTPQNSGKWTPEEILAREG